MDIFIDPKSDVGLSNQIYVEIRSGILEGRFGPGDRLPPTRQLATRLGVSRQTVTTAYGNLTAEGFLEGRRGGGTVVSELFAHQTVEPRAEAILDLPRQTRVPDVTFDLRPGTPDPRLFPTAEWKRHTRWAVDRHEATYGDPAGSADLRLVLARWIAKSRGVDASFRQLIVTSGAQQAFFLLLGVCVAPGDKVAMEDPGYHRFRTLATARGARIVPVPVDDEGIVVQAIPADVKVVYVTPSHQFPTGVTMSMSRRLQLLQLARDEGIVIIEDDYDSEFRYVDRPLEPLYRLDRSGLVSYVGSFSKTLSPALRLGFTVVPAHLYGDVLDLRQQVDWSPSQVDQLTLRGYIADGELERHLRRTRLVYQDRHDIVTGYLNGSPARRFLDASTSNAGLHVSCRLRPGLDESSLRRRLADRGVAVDGLSSYSTGSTPVSGLVLGFGRVDAKELSRALNVLTEVLLER